MLLVIYAVANAISIYAYSIKDETRDADVAIVLGAETNSGAVSPVYRERINHAVELYNKEYVDKLIVTGGMGGGNDITDAQAAMNYAVSCGLPKTDIITEDTSTITQENLFNSRQLMAEYNLKTALIISDPLHMRRAMLLADDAGIDGYSSPTKTSMYKSIKTQLPFLAREVFFYIGYKWYRLFI